MTPIDLTKIFSKFKSGWIAINQKTLKIVAHAKDFSSLIKKVKNKKEVVLIPASDDFSNIVTHYQNE